MRLDRPKRSRKAAKRLDLTDLRAILKDGRQWCGLGLVVQPTDGSSWWRVEMSDDGSERVDILVEVVLQPSQEQLTARLTAGMWQVPNVGEEVAVVIPAGRIDFSPIIVGILSSNSVPDATQGPDPTTIVITRAGVTKVYVHDGHGGAGPLCTLADHNALRDYILNTLTLPVAAGVAGPNATPLPPTASGTQIFEAK